ncbi:hypothetical protein [Neolewinella sp.]|uniref:hypothetical protein n=1 Tax=Neolewinella sp. TaxID=2993543 RepID=UPI003B51D0C1
MKFYAEPFTLTKSDATELLRKKQVVAAHFKGRKRVLITLVMNYPPVENKWLREVVDRVVTLGELLGVL